MPGLNVWCSGLAMLLCAGSGFAQAMRCGVDLAQPGDTAEQVLRKCGEPTRRQAFCAPRHVPENLRRKNSHAAAVCDLAEDWTYDPGVGSITTVLRLQEGRLKSIRDGSR